jgi:hypothetical protein
MHRSRGLNSAGPLTNPYVTWALNSTEKPMAKIRVIIEIGSSFTDQKERKPMTPFKKDREIKKKF